MARSTRHVGHSLVPLTEQLAHADADEIWHEHDLHPAEAAVATPFLCRMRSLLSLLDPGASVSVAEARRAVRHASPMTHLQHGPPELFESDLLWAAVRRDLLRCDETESGQPALWSGSASLERGPRSHLVAGRRVLGAYPGGVAAADRNAAGSDSNPSSSANTSMTS